MAIPYDVNVKTAQPLPGGGGETGMEKPAFAYAGYITITCFRKIIAFTCRFTYNCVSPSISAVLSGMAAGYDFRVG